jgi:hypothetical protein
LLFLLFKCKTKFVPTNIYYLTLIGAVVSKFQGIFSRINERRFTRFVFSMFKVRALKLISVSLLLQQSENSDALWKQEALIKNAAFILMRSSRKNSLELLHLLESVCKAMKKFGVKLAELFYIKWCQTKNIRIELTVACYPASNNQSFCFSFWMEWLNAFTHW